MSLFDSIFIKRIKNDVEKLKSESGSADVAISAHNTATDAHNDIRLFIEELTNRLNTLADSDDETLDQMHEVVEYIKANRELIESVTTAKVNVSDIIDNLTTNVTDRPLSAAQGVAIKSLIDTLQSVVDGKVKQTDFNYHIYNDDVHVSENDKTNWNNAIFGTYLKTSVLEYALTLGTGVFKVHLAGSEYTGGDLPTGLCNYATAIIIKRNESSISIILTLNGAGGSADQLYLNTGNGTTWYGWQNIYTDINPPKIAEIEGLQTIADNSQFVSATLNTRGWYRIAEYKSSIVHEPMGTYSNACEIVIKRAYANTPGEECRLLLRSTHLLQRFIPLSCNAVQHLFTKIRYTYDSETAYIDVYYDINTVNFVSFLINDGRDYKNTWKTITPILVEEMIEGETVSTVFDIPANANPVTDLDLADYSLANHTHNYAGSSTAGGAATTALACTGNSATATAVKNDLDSDTTIEIGYSGVGISADDAINLGVYSVSDGKIKLRSMSFDNLKTKLNLGSGNGESAVCEKDDLYLGNTFTSDPGNMIYLDFKIPNERIFDILEVDIIMGTLKLWFVLKYTYDRNHLDSTAEIISQGYGGPGLFEISDVSLDISNASDEIGRLVLTLGSGSYGMYGITTISAEVYSLLNY